MVADYLHSAKDESLCSGVVFLDLKKAFDTVDHNQLISKLRSAGVSPSASLWFQSYLENRRQIVRVGPDRSDSVFCRRGVPQGSKLGPLLFILYKSDLPSVVSSCQVGLYADDTCLYTSGKSFQSVIATLQLDLNRLSNWFTNNLMSLNCKKTELVLFNKFRNK